MPNKPTMEERIAAAKAALPESVGHSIAPGQTGDPQAYADTNSLTNAIHISPTMTAGMDQDRFNDIVAHELTHVKQNDQAGWVGMLRDIFTKKLPYGQDPNELAAFQTEADRQLASGRRPSPRPKFLSEGWTGGDTDLPRQAILKALK